MEAKVKLALPVTTEGGDTAYDLDLNDLLIHHPAATYFVQIESGSFEEMKVSKGDILVIDRSIENYDQKLVIGVLNGEFVLRKVSVTKNQHLIIQSPYDSIILTEEVDFTIWGVVTYVIHKCFF